MRFKIGDRVRIKSIDWYNSTRGSDGWINLNGFKFNPDMKKFCGKTFIIKDVWLEGYYEFKGNEYCWTDDMIEGLVEEETKSKDMGEVSDGYHTFNELYEYRLLYNASFFNELAKQNLYDVHKSKKHSDGEDCFGGGWFIVMAELPTGQVSNHYELKDWNLFQVPEKEKANVWDGHTPKDVAERIRKFLTPKPKYPLSYEECYKIIVEHTGSDCNPKGVMGYKYKELQTLQKLLVCRDAYWKIAGDEMGLGKPWEPDWNDDSDKYFICYIKDELWMSNIRDCNRFLVFPTDEMRNAFCENFKESIEQCKELL